MRRMFWLCLISCCATSLSTPVLSENIDVAVQVQGLVNQHGTVPYTHLVSHPQIQTVCMLQAAWAGIEPLDPLQSLQLGPITMLCGQRSINTNTNQTEQIIPIASNVRIVSTDPVSFEPLVTTSLPSQPTVDLQEFINCGTVTTQQSVSLAVTFQRSTSLALSHSVTDTQSTQLTFGWKAGDFSVGGSVTLGTSSSSGTVDTTGTQMSVQRTSSTSVSLAKGQGIAAQLEVWPVTYSQVFHTTATVDADLSPNDQYIHLADMYPSATVRTFPITGAIAITDGSGGQTMTYDDPNLTCPSGQAGVVRMSAPDTTPGRALVARPGGNP